MARQIGARIAARETELGSLRAANPQPKLWKKFETPKWGAGRNVRFGDLDGDGRLDMLIAQNIPKVRGDAFGHFVESAGHFADLVGPLQANARLQLAGSEALGRGPGTIYR